MVEELFEVGPSRPSEVLLFDVIPEEDTAGTAYDYARQFPGMPEELYYLLECATRENADPDKVVQACREVLDERNEELLNSFGEPNETLNIEEILNYEQNSDFSKFQICLDEAQRDDEQQPDILLHQSSDTPAGEKYDSQST